MKIDCIDYQKIEKAIRTLANTRSPLDKINILWEIGYSLGLPNLPPSGMLMPEQIEKIEDLLTTIRINSSMVIRDSIREFLENKTDQCGEHSDG